MGKRIISIILALCLLASCFAVVGAVITANAADYTQGYPTVEGYYTVLFTNNKGWQNVNIYSWDSTSDYVTVQWPGGFMEYVQTNDYGEPQYLGYVPANCDRVIFNNGSDQQTVDITIGGHGAYYLTDYNEEGKYNYGTFDVVFIDSSTPSESQPSETTPSDPAETTPSEPAETTPSEPAETTPAKEPEFVVDNSVIKMEAGDVSKVKVVNSSEKVTYTTSDKKVVKVDSDGKITALKKGTVKITAKTGTKKFTKTVKVVNDPVLTRSKKVVKNNSTIKVKKGAKITFVVEGKVSSISNTVKSGNSKIAKITSKASQSKVVVKANKKGSTTLTVKINGVKTYKVKINVK